MFAFCLIKNIQVKSVIPQVKSSPEKVLTWPDLSRKVQWKSGPERVRSSESAFPRAWWNCRLSSLQPTAAVLSVQPARQTSSSWPADSHLRWSVSNYFVNNTLWLNRQIFQVMLEWLIYSSVIHTEDSAKDSHTVECGFSTGNSCYQLSPPSHKFITSDYTYTEWWGLNCSAKWSSSLQ